MNRTQTEIDDHPLGAVMDILHEYAPQICQECAHYGECVSGLRKFCEAKVKPKIGAATGTHRKPPLTIADEETPTMATQEYENGRTRSNPVSYLTDIMAKVRVGWITAVVIVSAITNIAAHLVISGWIIAPARSTDLQELTKAVAVLTKAMEPIPANLIRIETFAQGLARQYDSTDHKLDVLIGRPGGQVQTRYIVKQTGLFGH